MKQKLTKSKKVFICSECGTTYPSWTGKCVSCGQWNTIVEELVSKKSNLAKGSTVSQKPKPITKSKEEKHYTRLSTLIPSLDEALGGGIVTGQVILLSGEPGIGKSTLLLQVASNIAKKRKVLYVTGEESTHQVFIRGERIGALEDNLLILSQTNLEEILQVIEEENPEFLIIDSVQTMYSSHLESAAGSVSQVREVSAKITELAKTKNIPVILIGQVTKEGSIAGPKVLEHIVDAVIHFEGERGHSYRVLKVIKNRFGSSGEIAVFSMKDTGLQEVKDPSSFFISEKPQGKAGSIIFPFTEGSKPVLVEVQALVSKTVYAVPQRKTQGIDINRLSIILAILEKEGNIFLKDRDVFINVVGGMFIKEPAVDLAVALAVISSFYDIPIDRDMIGFGEIGLAGEVRSVHYTEQRIKEARKFGFKKIVIPYNSKLEEPDIIPIRYIREVIQLLRS
ncbi:MAG: DNA repair protein RadA [Aquificae bacterium]|nr:DNA repair protein RadA [Aquificota bacterium]